MKTLCLLALLVLSGCTYKTDGDFCLIAKTITYSASMDTPATVHQIRQHNAVFQELCRTKGEKNR